MKLVRIFGPESNPLEGLFAVSYQKGGQDCFRAFLDDCRDIENVLNFLKKHLADLHKYFDYPIDPYEAVDQIGEEIDELESLFLKSALDPKKWGNLQTVFKPLNNLIYKLDFLQESKAVSKRKHPMVRIYAIRISPLTYVITGGAIKITDKMSERQHTIDQLTNIRKVCAWLELEMVDADEIQRLL